MNFSKRTIILLKVRPSNYNAGSGKGKLVRCEVFVRKKYDYIYMKSPLLRKLTLLSYLGSLKQGLCEHDNNFQKENKPRSSRVDIRKY